MHHPQPRGVSTYPALLEPVCRRRLPMPPDESHIRRSSSPRILPTPPPLSPEFRSPSAATASLERRASGRLLPRPPTADINAMVSPSQQSLSPVSLTPDPTPDEPECYQDESYDDENEADEGVVEVASDSENLVEQSLPPPPPRIAPSPRTTPPVFIPVAEPQGRRMSKISLHSSSNEQLNRKASSDNDDPITHGLDPSLYSPNAPIKIENETPIIHKTSIASTSSPDPQRPTGLGLLHCSLQHFPVRKRLRVSILKIEALAGELKPELEIHAICKVSIPTLKGAKEQLSEMKRGRDPVFNQEFFFDNVTHEELDTKTVLVHVCHQGASKIGKELLIGEAMVPLRDIREMNTKKEIKIVAEIKATVPKKLGKIYTSSIIEKDAKRLTINLKKVDDLPCFGFTGAPDVCVKITLTQGTRSQTKASRILKSTTTAIYNEAVMFLFGTSKNELAQTSIVISVHDMQRSCTGDDTIGCAYLGVGAIDKSEIEQWKNTTEHLGKEYKGNHVLKAPVPAPPVHVADVTVNHADGGDDEEEEEEEEE
ncbi:unnamed protein product [Caenorhabditis bovis]|uniref:C2 domain-containing protein n=1 Tax=Caenorhabditis bovis TaxID=2654633 RepID=A0A8S1F3P0_9PELO|nr:unnamed protein product [Caenorhabditis bovis]